MALEDDSGQHYFLHDGLGSVTSIADVSGSLEAGFSYDVFGSVKSVTGTPDNDFGFAGEQLDASGLTYLRARYLDSMEGRFTSQDPMSAALARPGLLNAYLYSSGNPSNLTDPYGMNPQTSSGPVLMVAYAELKATPPRDPEEVRTELIHWLVEERALKEHATYASDFGGGCGPDRAVRSWGCWEAGAQEVAELEKEADKIMREEGVDGATKRIDDIRSRIDKSYPGYNPPKTWQQKVAEKIWGWIGPAPGY